MSKQQIEDPIVYRVAIIRQDLGFEPLYVFEDMDRELAEILVEYNGKAVKTKDSKDCYLVKDSAKHLLKNEAVAFSHNTLLFDPNNVYEIPKIDFDRIPMGSPAKFEEGQYFPVVKRILEKLNRLDILSED